MARRAALQASILAAAAAVAAEASEVTPIQKVLEMLKDMRTKGNTEVKREEIAFAKFKVWCGDTTRVKVEAVDRSTRQIDEFGAQIDKASADIDGLSVTLSDLDGEITDWNSEKENAKKIREKEHQDYEATHEEYSDTLDACDRAINVIRNVPGAIRQALLQLGSRPAVHPVARMALAAFLEEGHKALAPEGLAVSAPKANAYESQSDGVMSMVIDLRQKFRNELSALEKEEMSGKHAHERLLQRLRDNIALAEQEHASKTKLRAQRKGDKAEAEGSLAEAKRVKVEDSTYLADTKTLCLQKAAEQSSRQKLRSEELAALDQAIGIVSGLTEPKDVAGGAASLVQLSRRTSFAQLRHSSGAASHLPEIQRVISLLRARAKKSGSAVLASAAQKAADAGNGSGDDPFGKVSDMIRSLITKLLEQANGEADHKGWCDAELATNKQTRQIKTDEVEKLMTESESLNAEIVQLAQEIQDLSDELSALEKSVGEASDERAEEKGNNARIIAEAKEGQVAVTQALSVLREFYAKAADSTALDQQTPADDAPETGGAYQGMQGESGGVMGMLEVIQSDFASLAARTDNAETVAEASYEKFVADSEHDKAIKNAEVEHKVSKKETKSSVLASNEQQLTLTQTELDDAVAYYDKLKPTCVDSGVSYEDRVARRKEEIESLKEGYKILSGGEEVPSFQAMKAEQLDGASTQEDIVR